MLHEDLEYRQDQERKQENAFLIGAAMLVVLQWLDLITTLHAASYAGTGGEINPVMRYLLEQHQEIFILIKGLIFPALVYSGARFLGNYSKDHPEVADKLLNTVRFCNVIGLSMVTINAIQNFLVMWNIVYLRS